MDDGWSKKDQKELEEMSHSYTGVRTGRLTTVNE